MALLIRCDGGCLVERGDRDKGWVCIKTAPYPWSYDHGHIPLEESHLRREMIFCPACWRGITLRMFLPANEAFMRFRVGEVYEGEGPSGPRRGTVREVWDEGHKGLLHFADNGEELTVRWAELHQAGKWRRVSAKN